MRTALQSLVGLKQRLPPIFDFDAIMEEIILEQVVRTAAEGLKLVSLQIDIEYHLFDDIVHAFAVVCHHHLVDQRVFDQQPLL